MIDRSRLSQLLSDELGIQEGNFPTSDDSIVTVASKSLRSSFLKKFEGNDGFTREQMANGEKKFLHYNDHCSKWSLPQLNEAETYILNIFLSELSALLHKDGGPLVDLAAISELGNLGPGANISAKSYNFYSKLFDSKLSMTSTHLLRIYRSAICDHKTWAEAERARFHAYGVAVVEGSSLFHVVKDPETTRTAATEPTLNMFVQKGIGATIELALDREFGLNLSHQPMHNRLLAQLGSRYGTFGTIDLKSASDCIAWLLCRFALPPNLFGWLDLARSPTTVLPDGSRVKLSLMSSMGNGFTFPLQTALFACLVRACYIAKGITPSRCGKKWSNWGVFGDDIVVRKDCYDSVVNMLQKLGFFVNDNKSFNVGPFRESCGGDFWHGHDVRGVYIKNLQTQGDLYSAANRLANWSARWGVPLPKTIGYIKEHITKPLYVPLYASDDSGYKVSLSCASEKRGVSWNKKRQQWNYLTLEPSTFRVNLRQPPNDFELVDTDNFGLYYTRNKLISRRPVCSQGKRRDPVGYNPNGLTISFLGGFIRDGALSLRIEKVKREVVCRHTSFWDSKVYAGNFSLGDEWQFVIDDLLR